MKVFVSLIRRFGPKSVAAAAAFGLVWLTLAAYASPGVTAHLLAAFSLCG